MENDFSIVYWDASAILSVLFKDSHSAISLEWSNRKGIHLLSTLAWAEVCAVTSRMKREGIISQPLETSAVDVLRQGPWRRMSGSPDWATTRTLSGKWPLRGADLWHLAAAKTLHKNLPELMLLTFDSRLGGAAKGEGLNTRTE